MFCIPSANADPEEEVDDVDIVKAAEAEEDSALRRFVWAELDWFTIIVVAVGVTAEEGGTINSAFIY